MQQDLTLPSFFLFELTVLEVLNKSIIKEVTNIRPSIFKVLDKWFKVIMVFRIWLENGHGIPARVIKVRR